jgi:nucleoside-diphosphate-sugar epimerase
MPHTLVTGANSFVAASIIVELISKGHTVTGIVRRSLAGNTLLVNYPEWRGKFEFVVVEDYEKRGAFDTIFQAKQYDHIVHTAAPMPNALTTDFDKHFLRPGVDGSLNMLNGANKYAPTLKTIAITGSANSITGTIFDIMARWREEDKAKEYTNDMWSGITPQSARESHSQYIMYCSGKKETELAVWEWVKTKKPNFGVFISLIYQDGYDAS